tara:strand:- start:617 stop:748 length:132 start_codon:yes stop_codon:yes gene_type:complete
MVKMVKMVLKKQVVDGRPDKEHQKKSTIPLVILPRLRGRANRF